MQTNIPEGVEQHTAEGNNVAEALNTVATDLGVDKSGLKWAVDMSWFKNEFGGTVPRDTVRIIAWKRDPMEIAVCDRATAWMTELLEKMELTGTVSSAIANNGDVIVTVNVEQAGKFIGRGGSTLEGTVILMNETLAEEFEGRTFRVKVPDNRERRDDRDDRRDRNDRDDRRDRNDRGGRRDRNDRGGRRRTNEQDEARLRSMTEKIAARVMESGEAEMIRKEMNSYDRRIVHMVVKETAGVESRSIGDGAAKNIEIYPEGDSSEE
jgi:predicted RNA-binding protein Jag